MTTRRLHATSPWQRDVLSAFLDAVTNDMPWAAGASCPEVGWDPFFLDTGESSGPAKTVCGGCTARGDCLEYALEHRIADGIWGGLSPQERRGILRNRELEAA